MAMNPRLLRPLATGFNPRSISTLVGWWDASDATTITLNGSDVSEWRDKSGIARHLAQTNATLQPAYVTGSENGRNAVVWPSASNSRYMDAVSSYTVQHMAFVYAPVITASTGLVGVLSSPANIGLLIQDLAWFGTADFTQVRVNGNAEAAIASNPPVAGRSVVLARATSPVSRTLRLGGERNQSSRSFRGPMCEVLAFSASLSTAQQTAVQRYLASKWGVTLV
jgi:hypothetical protein